jgi:glycerophosphoryl diester phosphodiesterase
MAKIALFIFWCLLVNSKNLYRHLRKRGVVVIVWVLNESDEWREALTYAPEIDGMMTDCPTKLLEFINGYKND